MDTYKVKPLEEPMEVCVQVPGSKSMTNRALLLAAMGEGMTLLHGVQFSEDSLHFLTALQDLGFDVHADQEACTVRIRGFGGQIPKEQATIYVGSAGTAARFLTAFVAMSAGRYRLNASDQMNKRPMRELLRALEELGARFTWLGEPYRFPMEVYGMGQRYGEYRVQLNIDRSSQFLSALLMTAPTAIDMLTIELTGKRSARSYVEMTEHMMCQFGHSGVLKHGADCYQVRRGDYEAREYVVEPDVSAACYFYAAAALTGGYALVKNVRYTSMQGDMKFLEVLKQLGCKVEEEHEGISVTGPANGEYNGVDVDMNDFSDQTMTLAAIAPFAKTPTIIRNIEHIRLQESDRIEAIANELNSLCIDIKKGRDRIEILPGHVKPGVVKTYSDHRMAMAFALIGLRVDGIIIDDYECCAKTFEDYFQVLDRATRE